MCGARAGEGEEAGGGDGGGEDGGCEGWGEDVWAWVEVGGGDEGLGVGDEGGVGVGAEFVVEGFAVGDGGLEDDGVEGRVGGGGGFGWELGWERGGRGEEVVHDILAAGRVAHYHRLSCRRSFAVIVLLLLLDITGLGIEI